MLCPLSKAAYPGSILSWDSCEQSSEWKRAAWPGDESELHPASESKESLQGIQRREKALILEMHTQAANG